MWRARRQRTGDEQVEKAVSTLLQHSLDAQTEPPWQASLAARMIARFIDMAGVSAIGVVFLLGTASAPGTEEVPGSVLESQEDATAVSWGFVAPSLSWLLGLGGAVGLFVTYEVVGTVAFGTTPGKLIMRLRVAVRSDRQPADIGRVALRTLVWAVPVSAALLMWFVSVLYAWVALATAVYVFWRAYRVDTADETLADLVAGTAVEDERLVADWRSRVAGRRRR